VSTPAHIFKCKHCQTPLGVTVGVTLYVGAVEFVKLIALRCVKCSRTSTWAPEKVSAQSANNFLHTPR
jgi:hypothetical protein